MKLVYEPERIDFLIVYLGRRGGGAQLLADVVSGFLDSSPPLLKFHVLQSDDGEVIFKKNVSATEIRVARSFLKLILHPYITLFFIAKTFKLYFNLCPKWTLFVLPSPFDWIVSKIAKIFRSRQFFMIHDFQSHLGERWPSKGAIKWRIRNADKIAVFSSDIQNRIRKIDEQVPIDVYELPNKLHLFSESAELGEDILKLPDQYILFVGRILEYKGLDVLIASHQINHPEKILVIAGYGFMEIGNEKNIIRINRWLLNEEVNYLLDHAKIVVFPYVEASQSGLLPIAVAKNKPIVITDLAGLVEQAGDHINVEVVSVNSVPQLSIGISKAWLNEFHVKDFATDEKIEISERLKRTMDLV